MGQRTERKMGITRSDAKAVATVLNAVLEQAGGIKGAVWVKGSKVIAENTSFCTMMEAVRIMKAPWEIMCRNHSWRWFGGFAAGINPNVTIEVPESGIWGKDRCFHVITVIN